MQMSKTILDNLVLGGKIQKINARSLGSLDNIKSRKNCRFRDRGHEGRVRGRLSS